MCKKLILGSALALTLTLTSPAVAAEEAPFTWPSIDFAEWVFDLLKMFELESSSLEMEPGYDPSGEEFPSAAGMGPELKPDEEGEPTAEEIGPTGDPNG